MKVKTRSGSLQIKSPIRIIIFRGNQREEKSKSITLSETSFEEVCGMADRILVGQEKTILVKFSEKPIGVSVSVVKDQGSPLRQAKNFTLYHTSIQEVCDLLMDEINQRATSHPI